MASTHHPDSRYSWLLAIVGATALIFTLGTPFSYGIFIQPLSDHFQITEVAVSIVFSIHLFASYGVAGVIAIVATRYPANRVILAIAALTALLAPSLYVVDSLVGLIMIFTLLGACLGSALIVIISVIPQWFDRRRGLGTGVLFVGVGLSLFVLPPTWNHAFATVGVVDGFLAVIGLSAVSFVGVGLVCRQPPWTTQRVIPLGELATWLSRLIRTRRFHLLLFGFGTAFAWFYLLAGYGVGYFEHRGLDRATASLAFGLIGGISVVSRLGSGAVADRLGHERTYLLSLASAAFGCLLLLLPTGAMPFVAIVFFGISLGGVTTLFVPIVLGIYDPDKGMAIIGIFSIGLGITAVGAPPLATYLVSATGSYLTAILLTLATVFVAMGLIWWGTTTA